ncbi:hypothetical protein KJ612_11400 [Myxococcota bacterium]|nr:hypothetical protein [Myxococcota bacterium]MBU1413680.1 hypothetical protein [Myxococcota bacterium]
MRRSLWLIPMVLIWGAWNPFLRQVPEVRRANDFLRGKDYKTAEEAYKAALESRASEPKLKHNLGLTFLGQNNYTAAEGEFIVATSSDSEMVRARGNFFLGITRFHMAETLQQPEEKIRKYKEAADNFRRVLELEPDEEEARHNLEMTLERIEDVEKEQEEQKKQQEQKEKQQQDQKDQKDQKDQQDQQNKDQQDQQNKDQQNKDQQNKDQQNKDQQNKDQQNKDQQNKDQQNQDQQNQDQQNKDQQNKDQQNQDQQNKDQQNQDQQNKDQQNKDQQNKDQQNQDQPQPQQGKPQSPEVKAARRALDDLKERQKQRILEMHRKGGQGRRAPIKDW